MEEVDLVIIGAGWNGLVCAKTALEVDPSLTVLVLESNSSVGGVWSKERLYKDIRTNNVLGNYEYSDFDMSNVLPDAQPGEHLPAEAIHTYLKAYTEHFKFTDKIRLDCAVESVEQTTEKTWIIRGLDKRNHEEYSLLARKLIMATGLTSQPRIPEFEGQDTFQSPIFHVKDRPHHQDSLTGDTGTAVTVLGGGKSAWDAVYACASTGRPVDWVIRESGRGPNWLAPKLVTPFKLFLENLPVTRVLTWFSPCVWADETSPSGFARRFLHGTWLGRKVVGLFWWLVENDMVQANGYDAHEETAKLRPWVGPFWVGTEFGIMNYPTDLFDLVKSGLVRVHVADIDRLTPRTVHLSNGKAITESSALVLCTGWKATPDIRFLPEGLEDQFGFPWAKDPIDAGLVQEVRQQIFNKYPILENQPVPKGADRVNSIPIQNSVSLHPFRLARFMVPVPMYDDHSVAFAGNLSTFHPPLTAEVQALWVIVYLLDRFPRDKRQENRDIVREAVLHTEYCRLRTPWGYGPRNADFVFDILPYVDLLQRDLGIEPRRKQGLLSHLFSPYRNKDYLGLVQEWKEKQVQVST